MKYIYILLALFFSSALSAHTVVTSKNLKGIIPPAAPGLLDGKNPIVVDKTTAIQLGKALFWDTNLGNNGVACASCHFHAGSDRRYNNQLNPGQLHLHKTSGQIFSELSSTGGGVNYDLKLNDFPFFKLENPDDISSKKLFETDDVVGSAGVYAQDYNRSAFDTCTPSGDAIFHNTEAQLRQVTKRNAPTVINAAFNRRNFWDGRANNEFNGVSVFGPRDTAARIWVKKGRRIVKAKLRLINSSLASQAVGPPGDMIEMSCKGKTFKDIAKKLLNKKPLDAQEVHMQDSILASLRHPSGLGLNISYEALIQKAFNPIYWSGNTVETLSGMQYTQTEVNFSLFLGLAIQLYEDTYIS